MSDKVVRIVLVDDHTMVRQGVRAALLELDPSLSIVGEAETGPEGLRLAEELKPDVLVTDFVMAGTNGIELTKKVKERCPDTRVIVLSMYNNSGYVYEALRCGASAYVLKGARIEDLRDAIQTVVSGGDYLSPGLSAEDVKRYAENANASLPQPGASRLPRG